MNNVLLDPLPTEWVTQSGIVYQIETDFRIGVQMCMVQEDPDLTKQEKTTMLRELMFVDDIPEDNEEVRQCIEFFLNGWFHDKERRKKEHKRLMDFDVDQWRIYSAFLAQYRIDLNRIKGMHFWTFMGLLSSLQPCAYTRVVDVRQRKFRPKMDAEERRELKEAKEVYEIPELKSLEQRKEEAEIYDFLGGTMSEAEQKRVEEFEKYADMNDEE